MSPSDAARKICPASSSSLGTVSTSNKVAGKSRFLKDRRRISRRGGKRREEEEEEEEAMGMARLHSSGLNGRFQKALGGEEGEKSGKQMTAGRGGCWRVGLP
jgi:hypothetical protein